MSGSQNNTFAKATLILQPPDNRLDGCSIISSENPSPFNRYLAFPSALLASISSNLLYIYYSLSGSSLHSYSSYSNWCLSESDSNINSSGVFSDPYISYSIISIWGLSFIPTISFLANAYNKVVFPIPFLPIRPYFLPLYKFNYVFSSSILPETSNDKSFTSISTEYLPLLSCFTISGGSLYFNFSISSYLALIILFILSYYCLFLFTSF